ncbi:MAG: hypothetical protein LUG99_17415 [Lachnospiraceae bacterium]|nr:hypothetical protein [Lachnospiraceae bacterium]
MSVNQNEKRSGILCGRSGKEIPEHISPELKQDLLIFMQTAKLSVLRDHIYCYPLKLFGADEEQIRAIYGLQQTCPSFYLHGFIWFWIIDLSELFPVNFWDYMNFNMIIRWFELSVDQLRDVALENIAKKFSHIKLSLLYNTTVSRSTAAIYEITMPDRTAFPEYGCSLMLSDHCLNIIRDEM